MTWFSLDPRHTPGDIVVFMSGSWVDSKGNIIAGQQIGVVVDVHKVHDAFKVDVYVPNLDLITTDWGESIVVSLDDYNSDDDIYSKKFRL